jgi:hypothetical protein
MGIQKLRCPFYEKGYLYGQNNFLAKTNLGEFLVSMGFDFYSTAYPPNSFITVSPVNLDDDFAGLLAFIHPPKGSFRLF